MTSHPHVKTRMSDEARYGESLNYDDACNEVRAVYDDIKHTRGVPDVNNFWKALAVHPPPSSGPGRASKRSWGRAPSIR